MSKYENPYRAAGTFSGVSYIERSADRELINLIEKNQRYPYILAPRQSGKSSLIQNTIVQLSKNSSYFCIFIDLSEVLTVNLKKYDQFLSAFCYELLNKLNESNIKTEITSNSKLKSVVQEIAKYTTKQLVIFIDEIDRLVGKTFKDDFFALIRSFFNQRSRNNDLTKIQFVLSGAAQPTQLITNQYSSPFNVGEPIKLENLSEQQITTMLKYCDFIPESEIQLTSSTIYSYTNGSVYLTQLILENLWNMFFQKDLEFSHFSPYIVESIVNIIKDRCQENAHFLNIYNSIINDTSLLEAFRIYVETKTINSPSYEKLKIIGIIDNTDNNNYYQNQIYKEVFGETGNLCLLERKLNPLSSSNYTKTHQVTKHDQDPPTKMQPPPPTKEKQPIPKKEETSSYSTKKMNKSLIKKNNIIPKNRIKRIEKEFSLILNKEIKEGKNKTVPLAWNTNKHLIERAFGRLALGMETLTRNIITDEEFEQLVNNFYSKENLESFSILQKKTDAANKTLWSFKDTYLQEYLAAKILAKQPLSTIKEFIALPPNQKYINRSWANTLPFLISLIDTNSEKEKFDELLDWIKEVSPNLILNFEPSKIDITIRLNHLKSVIENYKDKRLRDDYSSDYYTKLAYFGQSNALINYLLEVIKTTKDSKYLHKSSNCLDILRQLTIPDSKKSLTTQTLINCAISSPLGNYVQYKAITVLADLKLHTKEIVMQLVHMVHNFASSNNTILRQGLYYLLYNSDYLEDNIEIFLEGFKYANHTNDEYSKHISNGLSKIKSPPIILKVINYLTDNLDLLQRLELTQRQKFRYNDLINNAAQAYLEQIHLKDHSILKSIISLVFKATQTYNYTLAYIFVKFFDITSTRFSTFEEIFNSFSVNSFNNEKCKRLLKFLAVLADTKCIDFFIHKYKENPFSDEYIWFFYNNLANFDKEVFEHFEKELKFISDNRFAFKSVEEISKEEEKEKENRLKKDINLLFSPSEFLAEINRIFDDVNEPELTQEQLIDIKTNNYNNYQYSNLILQILLDLTLKHEEDEPSFTPNIKINKISRQEIQEFKWNWDWIRISKLYDLFEKYNELPLSNEQKQWISEYCLSNLDKVDFKTALVNESPDSASTSFLAIYLWYFLRKLDLKYPKNVLLDLLSFDWSEKTKSGTPLKIGINYLEEKLNIQQIRDRVLFNLQLGIRNTDVMDNHLDFCTKYKLKEAIPYIIHILANPPIYPVYFASSEHKANHFINYHIRKSVLETIYNFNEISLLEKVLPTILDSFKWEIVDLIVEKSEFCKEYLRKFLQNAQDKNEKLTATHYLIPFEEISALDYYVSYFEQGNEDSYFSSRLERFQSPLESLKNKVSDSFAEKSIPLLMRLLKASYQPQYLTGNFLTLNQTTLGVLQSLAMRSDNFYSKIKTFIEIFITDNSEIIPSVKNLQGFLDYLEKNYYLNKAQSISVKEVVSKLNSLILY